MMPSLVSSWTKAAAPPPDFSVSQWADAKRMLPQSSAARGGRWVTDKTPYLRGIMDSASTPGVRVMVLEKCVQSGGTEAINNILGFHMEHDPCAMLLVQPTSEVADAYSKDRLDDMIRSTKALHDIVQTKRSVDSKSESTLALKMFPYGFLALGGANTPNTFARWSVRLAAGDDVDRFPAVVGDEGDPADLLANRTESFLDSLVIYVSTPTLKGGRIDSLYGRTDQRRFVVVCPACGREDWITWSDKKRFHVRYDDRDPETARIHCPDKEFGGCGAYMREPDRRQMIATAALQEPNFGWQPTVKAPEVGWRGFHLPAMVSTLGKVTLPALVEKWLSATARGKQSTRVFINTSLAEGWEDKASKKDPHPLYRRRESYGDGIEVPAAAVALTAGVDAQESGYFQILVTAWGPAQERWVVDWRRIPGDPKKAETRAELLKALGRRYQHASGVQLPIHATCVDTGWASEELYEFVLANQVRRIFATKGWGGKSGEPIIWKKTEKTYGEKGRPVTLYNINVDDLKAEIYSSIDIIDPGPYYTHFPLHESIDEEFFAQLCSEHREPVFNKWKVATHEVWVKDRPRNEALDCAGLCVVAFKLLNPNITQWAEAIAASTSSGASGETPGQQQTPSVGGRRVGRSNYMENS